MIPPVTPNSIRHHLVWCQAVLVYLAWHVVSGRAEQFVSKMLAKHLYLVTLLRLSLLSEQDRLLFT